MVNTVGIIGAGQMGNGIAHVSALAGLNVVLTDVSMEQADKGLATIRANMERQASKGKISEDAVEDALKRIKLSDTLSAHSACDLVIEAAVENEQIKTAIFKDLCPHLRGDALVASNTSSISITRLAASTDRPDRFMGVHFMNPVPIMKLVELIPGIATSDETFEKVCGLHGQTRQNHRRFRRLSLPSS